jgi:type VI secretion system protein ImpF
MSGTREDRRGREIGARAQLPLLDRLIDDAPDDMRDPPMSAAEAMAALRRGVRRDLENLLNARRRWRSWPAQFSELDTSPLAYGIPDFTAGAFSDHRRRERLREDIEETIRRFEPRFVSVHVTLIEREESALDGTLHLRIDAELHADPAPEPIAFDTLLDAAADLVVVRGQD